MNDERDFRYTYSAKEQAEIEKIRDKYATKEESKLDRLRRLDQNVTKKAQVASLVVGIIGALIMGFGMSLCMTEFSEILGSYSDYALLIGIIVGLFGALLVSLAYPIYLFVTHRERRKIAPEILKLSDELLK